METFGRRTGPYCPPSTSFCWTAEHSTAPHGTVNESAIDLDLQDQYKFVYDTLEEHAICGPSWFPVKELSQRLRAKGQRGANKLSEYQREYQVEMLEGESCCHST